MEVCEKISLIILEVVKRQALVNQVISSVHYT